MIKQLTVKHSVSRAQDTYGYSRITLTDTTTGKTGKKYSAVGGGYDMIGAAFGEWLQDNHQTELLAIAHKAYYTYDKKCLSYNDNLCQTKLYGMTAYTYKDYIELDGACGLNCMLKIAKAIGLDVQRQTNRKGQLIGFFV